MKKKKRFMVAWLEDDDKWRRQAMRFARVNYPDIPIMFCQAVDEFWTAVRTCDLRIVVIDVMLPELHDIARLTEGAALAGWIRSGRMDDRVASDLGIPEKQRRLKDRDKNIPLVFVTGRTEALVRKDLLAHGVKDGLIFEKGTDEKMTALEKALNEIRRQLKPGGKQARGNHASRDL